MLTSELGAECTYSGNWWGEPCKSDGRVQGQGEQRHGKDLKFGGRFMNNILSDKITTCRFSLSHLLTLCIRVA